TGRLSSPKLLFAKTPAEFAAQFQADLGKCRSLLRKIVAVPGRRTIENTLEPFDELSRRLEELLSQPKFLFDVHPDAAMRQAGDEAYQEADRFATELSLNRELYDALAALDVAGEDPATRFAVKKILRDFRPEGVRPARPHEGIPAPGASREPRGPRAARREARRTRAPSGLRSLRRLHHRGQDDRHRGRGAGVRVEGRNRRGAPGAGRRRRTARAKTSGCSRGEGPRAVGPELLHGTRAGRIVRVRCEALASLLRV